MTLIARLVQPSIRFSSRLSFARKTVLGGGLVVALLAMAAGLELRTLSHAINITQRELAAIVQLRNHLAFWQEVVNSRATSLVGGTFGLHSDNVLSRITETFAVSKRGEVTHQLSSAAHELAMIGPNASKESRFVAYNMLSRAVLGQIEKDGRESGIFGDATLHLAANTLMREFPSLIDNVSKQVAVIGIANGDLQTISTGAQLIVLDSIERIRAGIGQLKNIGALAPSLEGMVSAYLASLQTFEMSAGTPVGSGGMANIIRRVPEPDKGFSLIDALLESTEEYLVRRAKMQAMFREATGAAVIIFTLSLAYLVWGTVLAIRHSLQSLVDGSESFCSGQMERRITVESQDEFRVVADNFNKIADEFNKLLTLQQEQALRSQEELQRMVEQRTEDLTLANGKLKATVETLRETQRELIETEKMAALGGLVAGVAHEVNTPVGLAYTIITHLQEQLEVLVRKFDIGQLSCGDFTKFLALVRESLQHAESNLKRGAALIESFKQVAVDRTSDAIRPFDLESYLREVVMSLSSVLRKGGHQIELAVTGTIGFNSYPGALSQVVTNIVLNAIIHGFDGRRGGVIHIEAAMVDNIHCRIAIADNGRGMPDSVVKRIFEPFFTTRRGKGGSGLGLHIVYNLVCQRLGGAIECQSVEGQGTEFTLRLPLSPNGVNRGEAITDER